MYSLDATSKESGARGRRPGGDGDRLDALAEVHVGQVVAHVFAVAADVLLQVASSALPLVVPPKALLNNENERENGRDGEGEREGRCTRTCVCFCCAYIGNVVASSVEGYATYVSVKAAGEQCEERGGVGSCTFAPVFFSMFDVGSNSSLGFHFFFQRLEDDAGWCFLVLPRAGTSVASVWCGLV